MSFICQHARRFTSLPRFHLQCRVCVQRNRQLSYKPVVLFREEKNISTILFNSNFTVKFFYSSWINAELDQQTVKECWTPNLPCNFKLCSKALNIGCKPPLEFSLEALFSPCSPQKMLQVQKQCVRERLKIPQFNRSVAEKTPCKLMICYLSNATLTQLQAISIVQVSSACYAKDLPCRTRKCCLRYYRWSLEKSGGCKVFRFKHQCAALGQRLEQTCQNLCNSSCGKE